MPRPTQGSSPFHSPTPTGLSPATAPLSSGFSFARGRLWRPYNPHPAVTGWVWANPLSLAATRGITIVFFSWGYLDVSVLPVRLRIAPDTWPSARWVAPFGYPRIDSCLPIPAAFRSLPRPSSPIGPKASPVRPFLTPFRAPAGVQLRRMRRFVLKRQRSSGIGQKCFAPTVRTPPASDAAVCLVAQNIFWEVQLSDSALMALQKGGVPAAPSGTATLLRLNPSHRFYPRALLAVTHFRSPQLPWFDGRCVQGPGTYSPRHG